MFAPMKGYMHPAIQASTDKSIASHGHAVIGVAGSGGPSFSYTIGLAGKFGHEFIIAGLDPRIACVILNDLAEGLRKGKSLALGVPDRRWANLPVKFMACGPKVREYAVQADAYHGKEVEVWQLVMCDRNSKFPGDPGYDHAYMDPRSIELY